MSTEAFAKFQAALAQNPAWQSQAQAISGTPEESARQMAALSEEIGFPVAVEVFLSASEARLSDELSVEDLTSIAGGTEAAPDESLPTGQFRSHRKPLVN